MIKSAHAVVKVIKAQIMVSSGKSTRFHERVKVKIPARVSYQIETDRQWSENTQTEQLTVCGAGFTLSHPVEPKRVVQVSLLMPRNLRLFDYHKKLYEVWALISYIQLLESSPPNQIQLFVGAALIGKNPPASYLNNPKTLYDLKPVLKSQSFWEIREQPRRTGPYARSFEERRAVKEKIIVESVGDDGIIYELTAGETINISESGTAITAVFEKALPKYVLIGNAAQSLRLLAAVRGNFQLDESFGQRLHLEFISGKWQF